MVSEQTEEEKMLLWLWREFKKGNYAICIDKSRDAIERFGQSVKVNEIIGMSLVSVGSYIDSLKHMEYAIREASPQINGGVWRRAIKALKASKATSMETKKFWKNCNSPNELFFGHLRRRMEVGDYSILREKLEPVNISLFNSHEWFCIHSAMCKLSGTDSHSKLSIDADSFSSRGTPLIIVSGMGWSGSGALYDYFAEFDDVVAITDEMPFIARGNSSLKTIHAALGDKSKLRTELFDFLFDNLIGFSIIESGWSLKNYASARKLSLGESSEQHFENIVVFSEICATLLNCDSSAEETYWFNILTNYVIEKFVIARPLNQDSFVLLDNVVPLHAIAVSAFLDNANVFCTFRDPRSNYCALVKENPTFHLTVENYINSWKMDLGKNRSLVSNCQKTASATCQVHMVQFEEFVLSERKRDELASKLGLDFSRRKKHSKFRPWESARNVMLHQEHPVQKEIKMIEDEMAEFCCEPCVRPL